MPHNVIYQTIALTNLVNKQVFTPMICEKTWFHNEKLCFAVKFAPRKYMRCSSTINQTGFKCTKANSGHFHRKKKIVSRSI